MVANYVEVRHLTARGAAFREIRLPRFFFLLESRHDVLQDHEGVVVDDADEAIQQSLAVVAEMLASGELPASRGEWTLVIRKEDGTEVRRIPI